VARTTTAKGEHRLPAKLVLLLCSTMVSVGVGAWLATTLTGPAEGDAAGDDGAEAAVTRTPELAAEAFLDAWRKREHDRAAALSTGPARSAVDERRRRDDALTPEERDIKEQVWDTMAADRLRLRVHESRNERGGRVRLLTTAEGAFLGREYVREIEFLMAPLRERWYVEDVTFGDILSEPAGVFDLDKQGPEAPREDPAAIEPRGAKVP
jgi:hypothetical protein